MDNSGSMARVYAGLLEVVWRLRAWLEARGGLFAPPEEAAINPLAGQHGRGWLRPEAPWRGGTAGPPVAPGQAPRELAEGLAACLAG